MYAHRLFSLYGFSEMLAEIFGVEESPADGVGILERDAIKAFNVSSQVL